jgi:hypothetical protein
MFRARTLEPASLATFSSKELRFNPSLGPLYCPVPVSLSSCGLKLLPV